MTEIQRIAAEIELILERGVRKLSIDFKYVRYAGSAALGMLIMIQKKWIPSTASLCYPTQKT